jgi:hypothetical protein
MNGFIDFTEAKDKDGLSCGRPARSAVEVRGLSSFTLPRTSFRQKPEATKSPS